MPDEPDEDLDDLDESDDDRDEPALPWPAAGNPPGYPPDYPPRPGPARRRGVRAGLLAVTAVVAAAAGYGAVAALHGANVAASPAAASSSPAGTTPGGTGPSGGSQNLLPPGSGGGPIPSTGPGETLRLEIGGRVTAVTATSITLGARGQSVTATVTSATVVTGRVRGISGVKVGDLVSAQITGTDGKLTATAIQDPASLP
jgi:hypothetical protein